MGVFLVVAERGVDGLQTELVFLNGATGIICNGRCQGGDRNGYGCAIRPHPVEGGVAGDAASMSPGRASATERGADDAQAIEAYSQTAWRPVKSLVRTHLRKAVNKPHGIRASVGRTGSCYDNAAAESFNATCKKEVVNRKIYPTRKHAIKDVTAWIE